MYRYINLEHSATYIESAESEYIKKIINFPYDESELSYEEQKASSGWLTLSDLRMISLLISQRDLKNTGYIKYLIEVTLNMYRKGSHITSLTEFGFDAKSLSTNCVTPKVIESHLEAIKYILLNSKLTAVTSEIIDDYSLTSNNLYLLYLNLITYKYGDLVNPKIIEIATIQYCLNFIDDFYLNIVFKNNELEESVFGGTIITKTDYINLAINNERLLSLDEVIERVF